MKKKKVDQKEDTSVFPCGCYEQMLRIMSKMKGEKSGSVRWKEMMTEFCDFNEISPDLKSMMMKMCAKRSDKTEDR
ncbi:hypothetical protein KKA14_16640 [bacterium]|nr:hypothetical protein [bacterium]